jgi:hypothetical protein
MAAPRLPMRKLREIVGMKSAGVSLRAIAAPSPTGRSCMPSCAAAST